MNFEKNNTKWVFFLGSSSEPDNRHIFDLAYGINCLESTGISKENIEIYIDGSNRANIEKLANTGSSENYDIKTSADFFHSMGENTHENMIMFVSGHGSPYGIDAAANVTPYLLMDRLKNTPNLRNAVVFLGQCYAGIFNYTGAGKSKTEDVDVIFIGATSLHPSMSTRTTETFNNKSGLAWVANVFLLFVFKWFTAPIDIDGDGKTTIIDCYKYAGCMTNNQNKYSRHQCFELSLSARDTYAKAVQKLHDAKIDNSPFIDIIDLELKAADQQYMLSLEVYHVHQECWILNSVPAQRITI